jgi:hypothetical protein
MKQQKRPAWPKSNSEYCTGPEYEVVGSYPYSDYRTSVRIPVGASVIVRIFVWGNLMVQDFY